MSSSPAQLFRLPFIRSYNSGARSFLSIAKVQLFLGGNFYVRLSSIYGNLLEALEKKNYHYIEQSCEQGLGSRIRDQLLAADRDRYRLRLVLPRIKPKPVRNRRMERVLSVRERVWTNSTTRIGVQCNVYFGQKFDKSDPLSTRAQESRVWQVGQFRYVRYYPAMGLLWNLRNMYQEQTFQLRVKYASKMYLEVQPFDEEPKAAERPDEELLSELVLRTGNDKFDWVIVGINDLKGHPHQ